MDCSSSSSQSSTSRRTSELTTDFASIKARYPRPGSTAQVRSQTSTSHLLSGRRLSCSSIPPKKRGSFLSSLSTASIYIRQNSSDISRSSYSSSEIEALSTDISSIKARFRSGSTALVVPRMHAKNKPSTRRISLDEMRAIIRERSEKIDSASSEPSV